MRQTRWIAGVILTGRIAVSLAPAQAGSRAWWAPDQGTPPADGMALSVRTVRYSRVTRIRVPSKVPVNGPTTRIAPSRVKNSSVKVPVNVSSSKSCIVRQT